MELHGYPYKQQEMVEKPKGSSGTEIITIVKSIKKEGLILG